MSGRLKHRPVSSSRSVGSTSTAPRENNGLASASQQATEKKKTRSRTDSGKRLPESERPRIKAVGEHWEVHPYLSSRKPPTVIGALVREMYPDFVETPDGVKPVLTWEDFKKTTITGVSTDKKLVEEFWWRFKCLPEDRADADAILELKLKEMVPKMLSEEKRAATKKLYKDDNVPPEDVDEYGNRWPTKEALISAKPKDFTTNEGWALLCEHWSTSKFRKSSVKAKQNRLAGDNKVYHRSGSRSLPATRQWLAIKNGADPGIGGAWLHKHELNRGTNDGRLCNQDAADKWAQYEEGMEKKYGVNWKIEHPELDASVIYECAGRMPHGKLGIGDGAISVADKEAIKTRKRSAQPFVSAKEKRLERENLQLRKEYGNLEHVVRALAAKQGMDFDVLAQETPSNLPTSESEAAFPREDEKTVPNASRDDNIGGANYSGDDSEDDPYDYEDEVYRSQDDGKYYVNHGYDDDTG